MRIFTHCDAQDAPLQRFVAGARRKLHRRGPPPDQMAPGPVVPAEINHGRWLARCPFCAGAEMVDPDDLRFWCLSCDNAQAGGKWLPVTMPDPLRRQRIEAELLKRPQREKQNWLPNETVAQLRRENARNGVT